MKKALFVILALITFTILMLVGCNQNSVQHNKELEKFINSIVRNEKNSEIDIQSLTDFTWDKAFLFTPYTPQESINEQLDVEFKDPSNIDFRDDIYLLVFLNEGKVVQFVEINRQHSDFNIKGRYLSKSNAIIKIQR